MAKNLFSGVRATLVGALVATIGGILLTACNSCCDPCTGGPKVYQRPCCSRSQSSCQPCGMKSCGAPMAAPAPAMPPPAAGGQKSCGAGKCG
jgi:hypothetical protein